MPLPWRRSGRASRWRDCRWRHPVRLLGLLADQLTRMEVRFQPVFSPDFPGEPEALLIGPLLILPGTLLTDPDARLAACHLPLAHPRPSREALEQTALLRSHRERLLRQGRLYLLTGAAAREECRQAVCPDADPARSAVWGNGSLPGVCPG